MINQILVNPPRSQKPPQRCVIALPGRGNPADWMVRVANAMAFPNALLVTIEPWNLQWYPQPFSAADQEDAVKGLPSARKAIEDCVVSIEQGWGIKRQDIALVGYSAGGVMALEVAARAEQSFGAAISLCGAILDPASFPECKHPNTEMVLVHHEDDWCFDWFERYLPMRHCLAKNGYTVQHVEDADGGHMPSLYDIVIASTLIGRKMIHKKWKHPRWEEALAYAANDENKDDEEES